MSTPDRLHHLRAEAALAEVLAEILDAVLDGRQTRSHDWTEVHWRRSVDDPSLLAAWAHSPAAEAVEVAWLGADGRLSVIDDGGHVRQTAVVVDAPVVVDPDA